MMPHFTYLTSIVNPAHGLTLSASVAGGCCPRCRWSAPDSLWAEPVRQPQAFALARPHPCAGDSLKVFATPFEPLPEPRCQAGSPSCSRPLRRPAYQRPASRLAQLVASLPTRSSQNSDAVRPDGRPRRLSRSRAMGGAVDWAKRVQRSPNVSGAAASVCQSSRAYSR